MTMTHKEALKKAVYAWYGDTEMELAAEEYASFMEAAIRAYVEARGLVMVPREPTFCMVSAYCEEQDKFGIPFFANATAIWEAILAAAPDTFTEE